MSAQKTNIGIIGSGHMAEALVHGILARRVYAARQIWITDTERDKAARLRRRYKVNVARNNAEMATKCSVLLVAVKPQNVADVAVEMRGQITKKHLLVSIAAGVTTETLRRLFAPPKDFPLRVIRAMPNTPALTGDGATAMFRAGGTPPRDLALAKQIFSSVGCVVSLDSEALLDVVTGLSGSGPAYVFLMMEAMVRAAVDLGLDEKTALQLVAQTIVGAGKLVQHGGEAPADLRRKVTSPGGTTLEGIKALEEGLFTQSLEKAVAAATRRARELAQTE